LQFVQIRGVFCLDSEDVETVKKLLVLLVLIGVVLVSGAYWFNHNRSGSNGDDGITYANVLWGNLTETVSATGILQPEQVFAVGSPLSGKVVEFYPNTDANGIVHEGDPLLKLDDWLARETLDKARAALQMAESGVKMAVADRDGAALKVKHLREVMTEGVGFKRELEEAEFKLKASEAQVALARAKLQEANVAVKQAQFGLDQTVVRVQTTPGKEKSSPATRAFVILESKVVLGQFIAPPASAQLFTLASDLGQMQVHAQVSENDIGKMKIGLDATFSVYAYPDDLAQFRGKVRDIKPMPNSVHGAVFYDTLVDTANQRDPGTKEWMLRPGMTASVDLILRRHQNVWKMPTAALSFQPEDKRLSEASRALLARWEERPEHDDWKPVWVHDSGIKVRPIFVRIGGKSASGDSGIQEGDYTEVFEWDPDLTPRPDPKLQSTFPRVITAATPITRPSIFDQPNLKVF
jgi:multidrug resistance efflux pump